MQRETETFDAIVVGSGISGGWAAKELTERGLRVLMLERGKMIEHGKDYTAARKAPWEHPHRGRRDPRAGRLVSRPAAATIRSTSSNPTGGPTSGSRRTPRSSASTGIAATTSAAAR